MPILENPKHEAYAGHLARGMKQQKAYAQSGYAPNPPAASRLANSPAVKARIAELKIEINQRINTAMAEPSEENFGSLKEMGLDMEWVAQQFKLIYQSALKDGQYAPANAAVSNIQKLIEIENSGKPEEDTDAAPKLKVSEVTEMLTEVRKIVEAGQAKEEMVDITPDDTEPKVPLVLPTMDGEE